MATKIEELKDATSEEKLRIDSLRNVLRTHVQPNRDIDIVIYCFRDEVWGSLMISEISFTTGQSGASYMHSDLDSAAVMFACQWYLYTCLMDLQWHDNRVIEDPEQEALRGVVYHMTDKVPDWVERDSNPLFIHTKE